MFFVSPNDGITPYQFPFFSALTQVRYLEAFKRLSTFTVYTLISAATLKVFNSLSVPVEDGGVLLKNKYGIFFEEYPTEVPTYLLNGWLTVLNELFSYGYSTKNQKALELARSSAATLIKLLPLYDMPEVVNSRYKLTGFVLNHIKFEKDFCGIVEDIKISTGGEILEKKLKEDSKHYGTINVLEFPQDSITNSLRFKVALSMIDYPEQSRLTLRIFSNSKSTAKWFIAIPQFNPRFYTPKAVGQRLVKTFELTPGLNDIEISIPWDLAIGWVGTAVPFSKFVSGKFYNAYHFIHIKALTQLAIFFPSPTIKYWRDKWLKYSEEWPKFHPYCASDICLSVLDSGKYPSQNSYLVSPKVLLVEREIVSSPNVSDKVQ